MPKLLLSTILYTSFITLTVGCGSPENKNSADNKQQTFNTPEECYTALMEARKSEDPVAALACFDEAGRNRQVGILAYKVYLHAFDKPKKKNKEDAIGLLESNSLLIDMLGILQIHESPGGLGAAKAFELFGSRVKDHAKFSSRAIEVLNAVPMTEQDRKEKVSLLLSALPKLKNVKVTGSSASGILEFPESRETTPIHFEKKSGSWLILAEDPKKKDNWLTEFNSKTQQGDQKK